MVTISTAAEPTTRGLAGSGGIPTAKNIVLTYPMAASASVSAGDFVELSSTTAGTVQICSDTADDPIGVAYSTVDNTSGSAGDLYVAIVRKGIVEVTAGVSSSGTVIGKIINFDDLLYLSKTASYTAYEGQVVTSTAGGTCVGRALDRQAIASGTTPVFCKMRMWIDCITSSSQLV